jgi:hypothetical protein
MESSFAAADDAIVRFLGEGFRGRRYLRYAELRSLGLISNRATLRLWTERGAFPAGIRLPGPYGTTLVWSAAEVATVLAERFAKRGSPAAAPRARVPRPKRRQPEGPESKRPATKTSRANSPRRRLRRLRGYADVER